MAELSVVGKSVPREDALQKVTGKALFTGDFKLPGMLYAKVLRSPYPHAKILRIDTSKAEGLPGVKAVLTAKDAPTVLHGVLIHDQPLLARDVVRFVGEAMAVVVADTPETAEDALEVIDVDYEELPAVFDVEEAFRKDPPAVVHPDLPKYHRPVFLRTMRAQPDPERPNVCHTHRIRTGDVEKGFQEADVVVENKYYVPSIQHAQLEPISIDAWVEPDGTLVYRSSKQGMGHTPEEIANMFGLPVSKVRELHPYCGGGFGGKCRTLPHCFAVLPALKTGRPVRLSYSREEMFVDAGNRSGWVICIKDGAKKDGTLVAREITVLNNVGAYGDWGAAVTRVCSFVTVGTYTIPNFKFDGFSVYTNLPVSTTYRGVGAPEINWAVEQQMDQIAEKIGMDPVEFRRKNILREGEVDLLGMTTHSIGARECLDKVAEWIEWGKPSDPGVGPWRRGKGIGLGCKHTVGGTTSVVFVKVHPDGVVEIRHNAGELGQGINSTLAQIAAEQFGVSMDRTMVVRGDTALGAFDWHTTSSRCMYHDGNALLLACQDAKRQLFELAAPQLRARPEELETRAGKVYVRREPKISIDIGAVFGVGGYAPRFGEILGRGQYTGALAPSDPETGHSERYIAYYSYGAYGVELAVNTETGAIRVERVAGAFDMGFPINPKICEGQVESGIGMGIGGVLFEEIVWEGGVIVNPNFADYKVPTAMDIPAGQNVAVFFAPVPHREGPYGAKGLGEGVLVPFMPAVGNAFYNATGVRINDLPLTRERVLKALEEAGKA